MTLVVNVSLIVGILIPGVMFRNYHATPETIDDGKALTFKLMLVEAIMGYLCFLPNIFFQQDKPPTPPSESGDMVREPFTQAVGKLLRNKNYLLLLTAFGLYFGLFNAISITLSFLLEPWFGNNSMTVTLVGGAPVISGMIGVFVLGPIQRKSGVFKKWIIICMIGNKLLTGRLLLCNAAVLPNLTDLQCGCDLLRVSLQFVLFDTPCADHARARM